MGDPGEPPEGAPEGGSGSDDEYGSVVFDESFVRAARIQELSARERLAGAFNHPVRHRIGLGMLASLPRQALTLLLLLVMAFGAAVYFGVTAPQRETAGTPGVQLTTALTALAPASGAVPAVDAKTPFGSLGAAAGYADGGAGLGLPAQPPATTHFSQAQVGQAVDTVRRYLEASALAPAVLTQGETEPVRALLAPAEQNQFDAGVANPSDDQHHAATGWMVRFDPAKVALAVDTVKVAGSVKVAELNSSTLEITSDNTMVYALRPAGATVTGPVTLFDVRRELRFDLSRTDIAAEQVLLVDSVVQAGPSACGAVESGYLQPLAISGAGPQPVVPGAIDPADHSHPAWQQCAVLASPKG